MKDKISIFIKKIKKMPDFRKVKFIVLFGSYASGKQNKLSDIDFAIYYDGDKGERYEFRKSVSNNEKFDVQIFQDLPLYVRINVLKGKVIYFSNQKFVYDIFYETIKDFERFKKYYYDYIESGRIRI
jgi:uncharacterized protein